MAKSFKNFEVSSQTLKLRIIPNKIVVRFGWQKARSFSRQALKARKLQNFTSFFYRLNQFAKILSFLLKLFNLFHKSNQLGKKINFLSNLFKLWNFVIFLEPFRWSRIGRRTVEKFLRKLLELTNFEKFQVIS